MSNRHPNDINIFWKLLCCVFVCCVLVVLGGQEGLHAQRSTQGVLSSNPENASESDEISNDIQQNKSRTLIREGTFVRNQRVVIRISSGRAMMTVLEDSRRFYCLENLNLERISKVIQNNPLMTEWTIDYLVTEYQGSNYVLIQRAVLASPSIQTLPQPK